MLVLASCTSGTEPPVVIDTSSARFAWVCDEHCTPEITDGTPPLPPCNSGTPLYAWSFGRFINIDAACTSAGGGWGSTANRSRPLACDDTLDCPQFTTGEFECRNGLCQNTDLARHPPTYVDWSLANTLCYAPFARDTTIDPLGETALEVYAWVQQACPSTAGPCALPLPGPCLQP